MSNAISPHWSRWIIATVHKTIKDSLATDQPTLLVRMENEPEVAKNGKREWVEIRIDGPAFHPSAGEYTLIVEINVLICTLVGENNVYDHQRVRGYIEKALSSDICIKKYGSEAGDDSSDIGTLILQSVYACSFGQIGSDIPMLQSTVETRGKIALNGV